MDWNVRRFIPDCSPIHQTRQSRGGCQSGWEARNINQASQKYRQDHSSANSDVICVACPPGMFRNSDQFSTSSFSNTKKQLCQLCPRGMYTDQFGSSICMNCPLNQTTRGLGTRKSRDCYYSRYTNENDLIYSIYICIVMVSYLEYN